MFSRRALRSPAVGRRQPGQIVGPGQQKDLAEGSHAHTDDHMVFRMFSKPGNNQALFICFPGPLSATRRKSALLPGTSWNTRERLFPSGRGFPARWSFSAEVPPMH